MSERSIRRWNVWTALLLLLVEKNWLGASFTTIPISHIASCRRHHSRCHATFSDGPGTIFQQLKDSNDKLSVQYLIEEWEELQEMIQDDDLTVEEVLEMCPGGNQVLGREEFAVLYKQIDDLFEDDEEGNNDASENHADVVETLSVKETLLAYLGEVSTSSNRLPCGLDCDDRERDLIQKGINSIEKEAGNLMLRTAGKLQASDILGDWNLMYTSSRAMIINKSLSGLGRSTSDKATFQGIQMRLIGNKFLGQAEFVETFGDGDVTLEVSVKGEWMLEDRRNIFTGAPSSSLRVDPESITYGISKNKAEEWASLGPIKLLDFLYCDPDLMVLRGTTNTESHFIYQRVDT